MKRIRNVPVFITLAQEHELQEVVISDQSTNRKFLSQRLADERWEEDREDEEDSSKEVFLSCPYLHLSSHCEVPLKHSLGFNLQLRE